MCVCVSVYVCGSMSGRLKQEALTSSSTDISYHHNRPSWFSTKQRGLNKRASTNSFQFGTGAEHSVTHLVLNIWTINTCSSITLLLCLSLRVSSWKTTIYIFIPLVVSSLADSLSFIWRGLEMSTTEIQTSATTPLKWGWIEFPLWCQKKSVLKQKSPLITLFML